MRWQREQTGTLAQRRTPTIANAHRPEATGEVRATVRAVLDQAAAVPLRPPRRPWHAVSTLEDFGIVTWSCDPDRLGALLPAGLTPVVLDDGTGVERAFVSVVAFRTRRFRFRGLPFISMSSTQVDHRAYVRRDDERGVWSMGTSLAHRFVWVAQKLWSMPWHRTAHLSINASWDGDRCTSMRIRDCSRWGELHVELSGAPSPSTPSVLESPMLADPTVAWYQRRDCALARYSVWHEPLDLQPIGVQHASCQPFVRLGAIDPGQQPVGALVTRRSVFDLHTPPRRC